MPFPSIYFSFPFVACKAKIETHTLPSVDAWLTTRLCLGILRNRRIPLQSFRPIRAVDGLTLHSPVPKSKVALERESGRLDWSPSRTMATMQREVPFTKAKGGNDSPFEACIIFGYTRSWHHLRLPEKAPPDVLLAILSSTDMEVSCRYIEKLQAAEVKKGRHHFFMTQQQDWHDCWFICLPPPC